MAKAGNDKTLAPSIGEGWDAWGATCGFTSWAQAANAIGITVAQLVTIRKKAPRKTIRLAMDAVLAAHRRSVPEAIVELVECRKRGWNDSAPAYRAGWNDCRDAYFAAQRDASEINQSMLAAAPSPGESE